MNQKEVEKKMKKFHQVFPFMLCLLLCSMVLLSGCISNHTDNKSDSQVKKTMTNSSIHISMLSEQKTKKSTMAEQVNWLLPTGGPYPIIEQNDPIWIQVSKEKQRVYIMEGNKIIYTMVCSTGLDTNPDTSTPVGTFNIQQERGLAFYNASEKEGAKYWVSWKNHGEFLFHSVATDKSGNVIPSEAMKLGHKASHGCIRLAIPDAKWIYENIRYNTKVVIS